ncbi:hypothetical protein Tco_1449035 [Tanacetum coccineum]
MSLDQEHLNAQDIEPSLRKRPHDDQDPPNDLEGEKRSKRRKDARESSSKSSVDAAKRKSNWFDMLLKTNMDQDEDCILGLSTAMVAKKLKELIKRDNLTIADLEGAGLEMLKRQYKNYVELEYHVDQLKAEVFEESQWSDGDNDLYYIEGIEYMISDKWSKEVHLYHVDALNGTSLGLHEKIFIQSKNGSQRVEVHKFCDGTLLKVQDNLLKMLNENNLGRENVKLEGRERTKNDIKRSEAMLEKIEKTLKHIE